MKGKVLVIEDNEQNPYLVRFILERIGYEVSAATDGRSGIETAAPDKPTFVDKIEQHLIGRVAQEEGA